MEIKISGLYILVNFNSKEVYPRIFTNMKDVDECKKVIGSDYEVKDAFINK